MNKIKKMSFRQLNGLCAKIRAYLIKTVPETGGHLASNLGTVELITALHKVFDSPRDKFVFDVGHQAYTHKILTGRLKNFASLRSKNGISGFPRPSESVHDAFIGGHAGISVSAALGIAEALRLKGDKSKVIAVAGDGSFTDGGIYEGLNNAGKSNANLLVVLNDNEMSISKSAGALSAYLSHLRATRGYYKVKIGVKKLLQKNRAGEAVTGAVSAAKKFVRTALYQGNLQSNLFENLGFKYYGPVDGHNLKELVEVFELAKLIDKPCLVHVKTVKGKGHPPAELNSGKYHGLDKKSPVYTCYSEIFGREIARLGEKDGRICLISAAMKHATGCNYFAEKFPSRFFDCGIAEAHAATFAAGLSSAGMLPVFAVYSTFSQRCFDRLLHDAAVENLHVVLAIDRAGAVGEDGETHQGLFDVGMFGIIPNFTVFSPANALELEQCLYRALYETEGPVAVRYPRGECDLYEPREYGDFRLFRKNSGNSEKLIISYGRLANRLRGKGDLLQLIKIQPLPDEIFGIIGEYKDVAFYEEGYVGGAGEKVAARLLKTGWNGKFSHKAFTGFVPASDVETQLNEIILL